MGTIRETSDDNKSNWEMETIGETIEHDIDKEEEDKSSLASSIKRHISHLENKLLTETSELYNRDDIVANMLKQIKLMENSSPVAAKASSNGIIDSNKMDTEITIFYDSMSKEEGEINNNAKQIQLLDKRIATSKRKLIERNDLIVDLLCHMLMLESRYQENTIEEIPSNEAVVVVDDNDDDNGGGFGID